MTAAQRWTWIVALLAASGGALVLAFIASLYGQGFDVGERHFVWLFWANAAVAALLLAVLLFATVRLLVRVKRGRFGSRLLLKLAGIFGLVGLLPGLVIYAVSVQFVDRSIEAWFDVRVANALDAGLALGRGTLDAMVADLGGKTRVAAQRLGEADEPVTPLALERLREQIGAREVSLLGAQGQSLVTAGVATLGAAERPGPALLRQARAQGLASAIAGLDAEDLQAVQAGGAQLRALALLPRTRIDLAAADDRFLLVVQAVPRELAVNALQVQAAYSEYQQRALARDSLARLYLGTLTLALLLTVFGSLLLAILLGNQLARPLLLLADGVRQVAAGDLTTKPVFASTDELGGLTRSFADMTQQLSDARGAVERGVMQLEGARTRLQTILDNLTAGVIVLDREGRIDTVNPGATRILRRPLSAFVGQRLDAVPALGAFAAGVHQRFELLATSPEAGERGQWQDAFELEPGQRDTQTLLARGAHLPGEQQLLVFDDITEVVSAQRSVAWAEVARRLAHEIKNPLTPIQLSAERLQHKLEAKLAGPDQALLTRSVATIVAQVQAMQTLVNEFRDYARLPAARLEPLDLNALVHEVAALYGAQLDAGRLVVDCEAGLPAILGDASQLRQVIHNLVQNALDAVGATAARPDAQVRVSTRSARAEDGALRAVRLTVLDNGPGFAGNVLARAFEPYVTTKPKGTGLGLAVVKKIADEHGARLRAVNLHEGEQPDSPVSGARVSLSFSRFAPAGPVPAAPAAMSPAPATGGATQVQ